MRITAPIIFTLCVGFCLAACPTKARADEILTFDANGTFTDGTKLDGSFTVDVATGDVVNYNLMTNGPITATLNVADGTAEYGGYATLYVDDNGTFPIFAFSVDASSLVGYQGGIIGSLEQPLGGYYSGLYASGNDVIGLLNGDFILVPEPKSLPIFVLGASLFFVARRRRLG